MACRWRNGGFHRRRAEVPDSGAAFERVEYGEEDEGDVKEEIECKMNIFKL